MRLAELLNRLRTHQVQELQTRGTPAGLTHYFDPDEVDSTIQKTKRRRVVTIELSHFEAVEVVRTGPAKELLPSPLRLRVPKGGTYGFDLIAHVGCETFLRGRPLQEIAAELPDQIPFSSLYDLKHKFLFYFGHLHRQSAPVLRAHFEQDGKATWLIDATIEPEAAMFFGVYEAHHNVLLDAWKIATENADLITPCLQEATQRFGAPGEVLHDLSDAMMAACDRTWSTVPHRICHYHFLRDIGEDLFGSIQARMRDRIRNLKLQTRLKEQRKGQVDWLRDHLDQPRVLADVLREGLRAGPKPPETLGREILVAFHQWVLDYAHDGHRQGFPFDPYLLYFHRRIVRASAALAPLMADTLLSCRMPLVLRNFTKLLGQYLTDATVIAAAQQYEQAFGVFSRLRDALRLTVRSDNPQRGRYELTPDDVDHIRQSLQRLREEFHQQQQTDNQDLRGYCRTVVEHLDRYWDLLLPSPGTDSRERTTNRLESRWGSGKRCCRKRHGRQKLTRDFQSLPADFLLVENLANPVYVQIVLGEHSLASKLAETACTAGPWTHGRSRNRPITIGHLPRRLMRSKNLLDRLVGIYVNHAPDEEN